jgi:D-alanine-D-alanine ligase
MGGPSAEREVSLASGEAVTRGLRSAGYEVTAIDVPGEDVDIPHGVEAVFIAMHGTFGEDGTVQALLEAQEIPYTGPGPAASRAAFDKIGAKRAFLDAGLPTPSFEVLGGESVSTLDLPLIVKPACQGSSIGMHRIDEWPDWDAALADALSYGDSILVESFIPGRELTVGVVCDEVLPVLEVTIPEGEYDYRAKYTPGIVTYRVPAEIPKDRAEEAQRMTLAAYRLLGCRGMSRIDFRMALDGALYLLEVNTIPGFTETSLLPKAAKAVGIEFPELCRRIMESASVQ